MSLPKNEEEKESSAPAEYVGDHRLNQASQLSIKPSVKTFTAAVVCNPKGELGFGNSFPEKIPFNSSKDDNNFKMETRAEDVEYLADDNEYVVHTVDNQEVMTESPKPKVFNTDLCRLDSRTSVPVWTNSIEQNKA